MVLSSFNTNTEMNSFCGLVCYSASQVFSSGIHTKCSAADTQKTRQCTPPTPAPLTLSLNQHHGGPPVGAERLSCSHCRHSRSQSGMKFPETDKNQDMHSASAAAAAGDAVGGPTKSHRKTPVSRCHITPAITMCTRAEPQE